MTFTFVSIVLASGEQDEIKSNATSKQRMFAPTSMNETWPSGIYSPIWHFARIRAIFQNAKIGEKRMNRKRPFLLILICLLLSFIGLGGLFGGIAFIIDPSGAVLGMDPIVLETIPILDDFLLPGIFLTAILGVLPLAMVIPLMLYRPGDGFYPPYKEWKIAGYISWILIAWIAGQIVSIGFNHFLQALMLMIAIVLLITLRHRDVVVYLGFVKIPEAYEEDDK